MKRKNNKGKVIPIISVVFGAILILISITYIFGGQFLGQTEEISSISNKSDETGVTRISVQEAKSAFDKNEAVFLDVRGGDSYLLRHIKNAVSIPLDELESQLNSLNQDTWIITYCT